MHIPNWPSKVASILVVSALLLPAAHIALSQPNAAKSPAAAATPLTDDELATTREQLIALLRTTPTLTHVLETDPSLLADQDYITRNNPQLAQFLSQHPEVSRNPDFYLFANLNSRGGRSVPNLHRRIDGNEPVGERDMRRDYEGDIMGTLAFVGVVGSLLWLIRLFLENRRWSRLFRLQGEVHSKLIDRFANNQDLLHYMETEPGKRFLEAAPIPIDFERDQRMPGGVTRVLGPLQIGIVLALLGIGLLILERSLPDIASPLLVFGMVALMPGLGFIISAIVTWRISARLGLMQQPTVPFTEPSDRP